MPEWLFGRRNTAVMAAYEPIGSRKPAGKAANKGRPLQNFHSDLSEISPVTLGEKGLKCANYR